MRRTRLQSRQPQGATISEDGFYRYRLWRTWDETLPRVLFCMLNPSTADARKNDQTIRKDIGFTTRLGCGGFDVVNMYAYRSTSPKAMFDASEFLNIVGPENDAVIEVVLAAEWKHIIAAWGIHGKGGRARQLTTLLRSRGAECFGTTANGQPRHPLMLPYTTSLVRL